MKISLDIDCTPEEARRFLGLLDLTPVNEVVVEELTKRAAETARAMDTEKLAAQWMEAGLQGFGELQKQFMERFTSARDRQG